MITKHFNCVKENYNKLKSLSQRLRKIAKVKRINTNQCKNMLFEIIKTTTSLKTTRMFFLATINENTHTKKDTQGNTKKIIKLLKEETLTSTLLDNLIKSIEITIKNLDNKEDITTFNINNRQRMNFETETKNTIYELVNSINNITDNISLQIRTIEDLFDDEENQKIKEFISNKKINLNENWVVATCYLSAIDVVVNRKRLGFGLIKNEKKEPRLPFDTRYDELIEYLKSKNIKISKVITVLPKAFWKIRTNVIHYGESPTQEELELIINWSKKIIDTLSQVNSKNDFKKSYR